MGKVVRPAGGWGGKNEPRIWGNEKRIADNWAEIKQNEAIRGEYCKENGINLSELTYPEKLKCMEDALEWGKNGSM